MEPKRIYRSYRERIIAGVCGGISQYFNIDPTIVRLIWAFLILCAGTGLLAYFICALIIPNNPNGY